jgi:hypothetical protein
VQSPRTTAPEPTYPAYPATPSTAPATGAASSAIAADRGVARRADAADLAAYRTRVDPLLDEWDALVATLPTATSVTRDRTIERLREIEQRASTLTVPATAGAAHGHLIAAMTSTIDAIQTAPTGEDPTATTAYMRGEELFDQFRSEVQSIEVSLR